MTSPHKRAQQPGKLFSQLDDIVAFGFEHFEKRTQVRGGEWRGAAMKRRLAMDEIVHSAA